MSGQALRAFELTMRSRESGVIPQCMRARSLLLFRRASPPTQASQPLGLQLEEKSEKSRVAAADAEANEAGSSPLTAVASANAAAGRVACKALGVSNYPLYRARSRLAAVGCVWEIS